MRTLPLLVVVAGLAGCQKEDTFEPMMTPMVQADIPASVEIGSAVGEGTVIVPLRLVNAFGVAIPGGTVDVSVQGDGLDVVSTSVTLDYAGYGEVEVSGEQPQAFTVTATSSSDGASLGEPATSYLVGGALPEFGFPPAWSMSSEPERLIATRAGVAWAEGTEVWWQPAVVGAPAWKVAELQGEVTGLRGGDLDADGLIDLIAFSGAQAVAMRGRNGGGFGWGVGYDAVDGVIADAAAGQIDGDVAADLVLAWANGGSGGLQAFSGDGVWGFEAVVPWELDEEPWSIGTGDFSGDGVDAVAVVSEGTGYGVVRRMGLIGDGWLGVGQEVAGDEVAQRFSEGAVVDGTADVNGDGVDELVFSQIAEGDSSRTTYLIRFDNGVLVYDFRYPGLQVGVGELSGDGLGDLVMTELDPGQLHLITTDSEDGTLFNRTIGNEIFGGAVAIGELSGDGVSDVALSRGQLELYPGDYSEETGLWRLADDNLTRLMLSGVGPAHAGDFDADGALDLLVFRISGDSLYAQRYRGVYSEADGFSVDTSEVDRVAVEGPSGAALDLAVCGELAYALVEGSSVTLHAMDISGGTLRALGNAEVSGGLAVDCGAVDGSAGAVVLDDSGNGHLFDSSANALGSLPLTSGAVDVAVVAAGGDPSFVSCETDGCAVGSADLDGDGEDEWVSVIDGVATLNAWGQEWSYAISGEPSFYDVDGDGRLDVLLTDGGQISIVRTLDGGFAPAARMHLREAILGAAMWGDTDGDGVGELLFADDGGRVLVSQASSAPDGDDEEE